MGNSLIEYSKVYCYNQGGGHTGQGITECVGVLLCKSLIQVAKVICTYLFSGPVYM